jgi:hypothetical protein
MPKQLITTPAEMEAFVQIWKFLSANGKLFIPVHEYMDSVSVYAEEDEQGNKTIRAFMDSEAIALYIQQTEPMIQDTNPGFLKAGISPVKLLQKKLVEVYGKDQKEGKNVECLLTTYDESGSLQDVDTIWSQSSN